MTHTVVGIFDNRQEAERAVDKLVNLNISRSNIDISDHTMPESSGQTRYEQDPSLGARINNFFRNLFDDEEEARNYANVSSRSILVTVLAESYDQSVKVAHILDQYGAVDVNDRAARYRKGSKEGYSTSSETTNIPIIEEEMHVGKRVVEEGGVQLRSRIIERPVEETIRLRYEHIDVQRRPVNRPATEQDFQTFKEGEAEFTERREVPVVDKEARVVEEINLNKEIEEREEKVKGTVKKTEVDIKNKKKRERGQQ